MISVQVYLSLVKIRQNQYFSGLQLLLISYDVSQAVIKACLERSIGLDLIVAIDAQNLRVMIKDLILKKVELRLV